MDTVPAPGAPPIDRLQVDLQTRSIMASQCISELNDRGHEMHLQTRSITASKCISILLDLDLQVHLQTRSIAASQFISKLAQSRPPSASLSSLDHALPVLLQTH